MPFTTPCSSVFPVVAVPLVALSVVLDAARLPRPWPSPGSCPTASVKRRLDLRRLLGDAAEDHEEDQRRRARRTPRSTRAAPAARGIRWRCIFVTSGPATVARIAPRATGIVIVEVSAEQPREPDEEDRRRRRGTTRAGPRSRSHIGAENTRERAVASICDDRRLPRLRVPPSPVPARRDGEPIEEAERHSPAFARTPANPLARGVQRVHPGEPLPLASER